MRSRYPSRHFVQTWFGTLMSRDALICRLAVASIAGQLAWVAIAFAAGFLEPGYSEIRDAVSELGADTATRPWLFNIAVAIWALSFIAVAIALLLSVFAMAWRFRGDSRWGRADLLAAGAGLLGIVIFAGLFFNTAAVHTFMLATARPRSQLTSRTSA